MSHTDGIIDNSLTTWINVHQAQVGAQPAGFVPLATNDQDIDQVAVIEDDGTLLIPAGASNSLDHIAIVEKFYQTHADLYDFLLIIPAVPVTNGSVFKLVHNVTVGTTVDLEDNRDVLASHPVAGAIFDPSTGEIRHLKGLTQYVDLTSLPVDPNTLIAGNNDTPLSLIAQEIGHYWGMAAPYAAAPGGPSQANLQGRGNSHWSFFAHTQASSMEGNSWQDNGGVPNSFTSVANTNGYFPFDLYLMGFLDPALTADTFFINTPSADTLTTQVYAVGSTPVSGANITGTRVNVTATQLINAMGARVPDFTLSQKDFKAAFIMVVANGDTAPANAAALQASVDQVNGYRTAWEAYWSGGTLGTSTMDTALDTGRNVDIYVRDNLADDGSTPSVGILYASPDIVVRQNLVANPGVTLGDPTADPGSDPVEIGNPNYIYVRVHNRGDYPTDADIKVYFADLTTAIDPATWTLIGETKVNTVTPGATLVSDPVTWASPPDPGAGHFCVIAMLDDPLDPEPDTSGVVDAVTYLDFVRNNNNVAYRNLTFVDLLADADADMDFFVGSFKKTHTAILELDGSGLPRGAFVRLVLPARWRRARGVRIKGFERNSSHKEALILAGGRKGLIDGLRVRAGSRNRVRMQLRLPANLPHRLRGSLEVVHRVGRQAIGGVGNRFEVIAREKARFLGVIRTGLFYPADSPKVRKLANRSLRPFQRIDDALRAGFNPGRGFVVDTLGPKAVRGKVGERLLASVNGARKSAAFFTTVERGLGRKPAHYTRSVNRLLFRTKRERRRFDTIDEIFDAVGNNGAAFAELVDSVRP